MATRADIKTAILGLLPDNILQEISPLDERDSFDLVIDNFLNIDDNQFTNGLTLDGLTGNIELGGAVNNGSGVQLTIDATIGTPQSLFNMSSGFNSSTVGFITYPDKADVSIYTGIISSEQFSSIEYTTIAGSEAFYATPSGLLIFSSIFNKGAEYGGDYSSNYVARSLTDKAYQDGHLAGVTASALAQNPTATEDGFALVYDHGTTAFTLASVGGGGSSTFDGLTDTPANKVGSSDFFVAVNSLETQLEYISSASATARLDVFTPTLKGLVPLSGGGTTEFLRADGSWIVPDYASVAITDNYIPIGNATNDGVEDSMLSSTFGDVGFPTTTFLRWDSDDPLSAKLRITGSETEASKVYYEQTRTQTTRTVAVAGEITLDTYVNELRANEMSIVQAQNIGYSSNIADYTKFTLPQGGAAFSELVNLWSKDQEALTGIAGSTFFMTYGGIDYMGHKYGTTTDPRISGFGGANNYTWLSDGNQHFAIGGQTGNTNSAGAMNGNNAHLMIYSNVNSANPEPHLRFVGDYDTALNGAASNNSMYLDAIDSKLHFKGSAGQDLILEDFILNVATGANGFAVGGATSASAGGVAIGNANGGSNLTTVAIGDTTSVTGLRGIAIGYNTSSDAGVTIGVSSTSTSTGVAIGQGNTANSGVAIGLNSSSTGGVAIGQNAVVTGSVGIGTITVSGTRGIGIGAGSASVTTTDSIGIGSILSVVGNNAYAIGRGVKAGESGITIGWQAGNSTGTIGSNAITFGTDANGASNNIGASSIAMGAYVDSTVTGAVTLGYGTGGINRLVNSTTNSFGLGFASLTPDFLYSKAGQFLVKNLPTYADDTAAAGGGVALEEIYKTATGELRIRVV